MSQQTCILGLGFIYSKGGTHKEILHPQRSLRIGTSDKGAKTQLDKLWIHKTDAVIV